MNKIKSSNLENDCRTSLYCPVCNTKKENNSVMCWDCFKYTKDRTPYKYSNLDLLDYLMEYTDYAICELSGTIVFKNIDPEQYEHTKHYGIIIQEYDTRLDYMNSIHR